MPKFNDLTNMKFNKLIAINSVGKDNKGAYLWECLCDCGNKVVIRVDSLKNSHTKSCGKCPTNIFYKENDYMVGIAANNNIFYFDLDDYEKIKQYNWCVDGRGYLSTRINEKTIKMHRFIMNFPNSEIDHINNIKTDNRKQNLRLCDQKQNTYNKSKYKGFTSNFKGVSYKNKKWCARINYNNNHVYLGVYSSELEAAQAYNKAALIYHGEFAKLNEVVS